MPWVLFGVAMRPTQALCPSCEVVVGAVRVQALSATLLRVEPKGRRGFEDRGTFMAVNRTFAGVEATPRATPDGTNITTPHYSVLLRHNGSFVVHGGDGGVVYSSAATRPHNLLHWPSPLVAEAYAIEDRPRFVPPLWAPAPAPAGAALQASRKRETFLPRFCSRTLMDCVAPP